MAERVEITDVTIPTGTAIAAPVVVTPDWNDGVVERIQMRWPSGPAGFVGLRIAHSGQVIIPSKGAAWLITDNEIIDWPLSGYPTGQKWTILGYNLDQFDHTIQIRWLINEIPMAVSNRPALVAIE